MKKGVESPLRGAETMKQPAIDDDGERSTPYHLLPYVRGAEKRGWESAAGVICDRQCHKFELNPPEMTACGARPIMCMIDGPHGGPYCFDATGDFTIDFVDKSANPMSLTGPG